MTHRVHSVNGIMVVSVILFRVLGICVQVSKQRSTIG